MEIKELYVSAAKDKEYSEIECINCTGKIDGNKVTLTDIPPFAFAGFEVKKTARI